MFWRMAGMSTASPVDAILDRDRFTIEELLDEDEIIQECKALNGRLINFLRERTQVECLIRYIVEEAPEDAEKTRTFKFPFVSCEVFICEVDIILRTLVEDEELMDLLFSFLEPDHSHSTLLAGYFSKVVISLLMRKTAALMNYIEAHQIIFQRLVDLIGITSVMEILIRLIGADENLYANCTESVQWFDRTDVIEMIADKFSSSNSPEVHCNAAETLYAISRYAVPSVATKISTPSFVRKIFQHSLDSSRPKSVLVNSLSLCICLLDPKRLISGTYQLYSRQMSHEITASSNPEIVDGILENLGDLLKLLDISSCDGVLVTTYGQLKPPLGKHRLKIIEFLSVLLTIGSEFAENELVRLGALQQILNLFFEYPYNNFMHHFVETAVVSCLESKNPVLVNHLFNDCDLVGRILRTEKNTLLDSDPNKPTLPVEGRSCPRIGNIGHLTRISNKLVQVANNNIEIQNHLQENSEWVDWHSNVLLKRNAVENVFQWACGRPTTLQDRTRDSDDDEYQDRDFDVAALANNLTQVFRYGIYSNSDVVETGGPLERDDEDVYFDDESAEVVISSLRLGEDQDNGSLFTNSDWFAFEDDRGAASTGCGPGTKPDRDDEVIVGEDDDDDDLIDTATSSDHGPPTALEPEVQGEQLGTSETPDWVQWRETSGCSPELDMSSPAAALPNGELEKDQDHLMPAAALSPAPAPAPALAAAETGKAVKGDVEMSEHGNENMEA